MQDTSRPLNRVSFCLKDLIFNQDYWRDLSTILFHKKDFRH